MDRNNTYANENLNDEKAQASFSQLKEYLLELEEIYKGYYTPFDKLFFLSKQFDLELFEKFTNQLAYLSVNDPRDESTLDLYKSFIRTTVSFLLLNCGPRDWHLKSIVKIVNLFTAETNSPKWRDLRYADTVYSYLCEIDDSEYGSEPYKIFTEIQPVFENLFHDNIEKCCMNMPTDINNGIRRYIAENIPTFLSNEDIFRKAAETFSTASYYAKKDMGLIHVSRNPKV